MLNLKGGDGNSHVADEKLVVEGPAFDLQSVGAAKDVLELPPTPELS